MEVSISSAWVPNFSWRTPSTAPLPAVARSVKRIKIPSLPRHPLGGGLPGSGRGDPRVEHVKPARAVTGDGAADFGHRVALGLEGERRGAGVLQEGRVKAVGQGG